MLIVLWHELKRAILRRVRSPLESITESLAAYIFLVVAVLAASRRVPVGVGAGISSVGLPGMAGLAPRDAMFAFACIFCSLGAVQGASQLSTEEPGTAILDQLAMSALPLWVIALVRDIASLVTFVPSMALIMGAVSLTVKEPFPMPAASALAPIVMMRLGMLGIGYALGAVALLAKRIGGVVNLVSIAIFALAFAPARQAAGAPGALDIVFPYRWWYQLAASLSFGGADATHNLAGRGAMIGGVPCLNMTLASAVTLAYLLAGLAAFNAAFRASLQRGSLSKA